MHCGTELPSGALFCGECGRAVSANPAKAVQSASLATGRSAPIVPPRWVDDPVTGEALDRGPSQDEAADADIDIAPRDQFCEQCGHRMAHNDIFCEECGFVSRSVTQAFSTSAYSGETRSLSADDLRPPPPAPAVPTEWEMFTPPPSPESQSTESQSTESHSPEPEPVDSAPVESVPVESVAEPVVPEPVGSVPVELVPEPVESELVEPELVELGPVESPVVTSVDMFVEMPVKNPPEHADQQHAPFAPRVPIRHFETSAADDEDLEATRIVSRLAGNRFVLQFSTGESVTVHGSGLVGRNPQPEPGEFFDHLVRIFDAGKSVSKTHLEFGQEGGAFWIKDRFSGNGTVIKEPDISARRAEADRRYRVVRGTRVDIGEQFFVIS